MNYLEIFGFIHIILYMCIGIYCVFSHVYRDITLTHKATEKLNMYIGSLEKENTELNKDTHSTILFENMDKVGHIKGIDSILNNLPKA